MVFGTGGGGSSTARDRALLFRPPFWPRTRSHTTCWSPTSDRCNTLQLTLLGTATPNASATAAAAADASAAAASPRAARLGGRSTSSGSAACSFWCGVDPCCVNTVSRERIQVQMAGVFESNSRKQKRQRPLAPLLTSSAAAAARLRSASTAGICRSLGCECVCVLSVVGGLG